MLSYFEVYVAENPRLLGLWLGPAYSTIFALEPDVVITGGVVKWQYVPKSSKSSVCPSYIFTQSLAHAG